MLQYIQVVLLTGDQGLSLGHVLTVPNFLSNKSLKLSGKKTRILKNIVWLLCHNYIVLCLCCTLVLLFLRHRKAERKPFPCLTLAVLSPEEIFHLQRHVFPSLTHIHTLGARACLSLKNLCVSKTDPDLTPKSSS